MNIPNNQYPPPWDLSGEGFIISFVANKEETIKNGFLSEEDKKSFVGGLGGIIIVNYEKSNVGPYYELLYIPGDFVFKGRKYKRITKIFVSSELSVREGITNWAIPKEVAQFTWTKNDNNTKITASTNGIEFAKFEFEKILFSFPISTSLLPYVLLQKSPECYLQTQFTGNGSGKIALLKNIETNPNYFPNSKKMSSFSLPSLGVDPFRLTFPIPIIHEHE